MSGKQHKYLKAEDVRRLKSYEFAPKALAEGYLAGRHPSHVRGASIEFHDYRQYVPGDDRALIDWRVYGRTDRYYLRTFEQETNMSCNILLDSSASMGFGEKISKLEYASFFTAAFCYLVIHGTDRVSLTLFDERVRSYYPAGSTTRHLNQILNALEDNHPGERTSVAAALNKCVPLFRQRGSIIVISDFLDDPAAIFQALAPFLHRGFRVHLCQILDPGEVELTREGMTTFVDMESGERVVAHAGAIRESYRAALQKHNQGLRELAARRQVDFVSVTTDMHYFELFDHLVRA